MLHNRPPGRDKEHACPLSNFSVFEGGGKTPPQQRHRKPFPLSLPGGELSPPGSRGWVRGGTFPPLAQTSETVFVVAARGGKFPPPWRHWNWRGDRRSETVFVAPARERGQALGNRFRCPCQGEGTGVRKPFSLSLPGDGGESTPPGVIGIGEGTGVRKPFSLSLPGRGDRRSETIFVFVVTPSVPYKSTMFASLGMLARRGLAWTSEVWPYSSDAMASAVQHEAAEGARSSAAFVVLPSCMQSGSLFLFDGCSAIALVFSDLVESLQCQTRVPECLESLNNSSCNAWPNAHCWTAYPQKGKSFFRTA